MPKKVKRVVMATPDIMIDRRIILEALSLIKEGKEVILIAGNDGKMEEHEIFEGIKIHRPLFNGVDPRLSLLYRVVAFGISIFSAVLSRILRMLGTSLDFITLRSGYDLFLSKHISYYRPDVVHIHDLPFLAAGVISSSKGKVPLVYDSHEFYTEQNLPFLATLMLKRKERSFIKKTDTVITVNSYMQREFEKKYSINNVIVIENATKRKFELTPEKKYNLFRKDLVLPPESKLILFQGWFCEERNLATLVNGMTLLDNDYYLLFMGYGDYINELLDMAKDLGIKGRIISVPAKTQAELLYYTSSADIGVIPYTTSNMKNLNHLYSSPNKLYEFIAAGLPVLASDLPFYRDVLGKYNNGIIRDFETPEGFAKGVKDIFAMDLDELRRNALAAYEDLNWDNEAEKLKEIYEDIEGGL